MNERFAFKKQLEIAQMDPANAMRTAFRVDDLPWIYLGFGRALAALPFLTGHRPSKLNWVILRKFMRKLRWKD